MTFEALEESRTLGVPTELYYFGTPDGSYKYTDSEDNVSYAGGTYVAVPISRTAITASGSLDRATITVSIAQDTPLAALLRSDRRPPVSLVIRQGHRADPEFLVAWAGRVLSSKGNGPERQLTCQPVSTSLKRIGLRRNWQYGCPHVLYGDRCRADRDAASITINAVVSGGGPHAISVDPGLAPNQVKYAGGTVRYGTEVATILRAEPIAAGRTRLTLSTPVPFTGSATVVVSLGCDHTVSDCKTLHVPRDEADYGGGNIHNYGGQPLIPLVNPIGYVSRY